MTFYLKILEKEINRIENIIYNKLMKKSSKKQSKIKFNFWTSILLPFVLGGIIVMGTSLIAEKFSTKWAALFWSIPFTFIPVAMIIWYKTKDRQLLSEYAGNMTPSLIVLVGFIITFWLATKKFDFWPSLGCAFATWTVLAVFYSIFVCPSFTKCIQL